LKVCIVGYLRPEKNFSSLDALITEIKNDILKAENLLEVPENLALKQNEFFHPIINNNSSSSMKEKGHVTNGVTNGHL